MPTWEGLPYKEKSPDSPEENFGLEGAKATMTLLWPGPEREVYARRFLGFTEVITAAGTVATKYYRRWRPFYHPRNQTESKIWAESVRLAPDRAPVRGAPVDAAGVGNFEEFWATLSMSDRPYDIQTDEQCIARQVAFGWPEIILPDEATLQRYVSVTWHPRGTFQTLPSFAALRWVPPPALPASQMVSNTVAVPILDAELEITHYQIPIASVPAVAINACIGKTNSDLFGIASDGNIFKPYIASIGRGRLIYLSGTPTKPYRQPDGSFAVNIVHKLVLKPNGANYWYNWNRPVDSNPWQEASRDGITNFNLSTGVLTGNANNLTFPPVAFAGLFRPQ